LRVNEIIQPVFAQSDELLAVLGKTPAAPVSLCRPAAGKRDGGSGTAYNQYKHPSGIWPYKYQGENNKRQGNQQFEQRHLPVVRSERKLNRIAFLHFLFPSTWLPESVCRNEDKTRQPLSGSLLQV